MRRTTKETQDLYWFSPPFWCNTLLQCVVWWIASWADDEQYKEEQPREGLFLWFCCPFGRVDSRCLSHLQIPVQISVQMSLPCGWLVLFIGEGPGPLPKY